MNDNTENKPPLDETSFTLGFAFALVLYSHFGDTVSETEIQEALEGVASGKIDLLMPEKEQIELLKDLNPGQEALAEAYVKEFLDKIRSKNEGIRECNKISANILLKTLYAK